MGWGLAGLRGAARGGVKQEWHCGSAEEGEAAFCGPGELGDRPYLQVSQQTNFGIEYVP